MQRSSRSLRVTIALAIVSFSVAALDADEPSRSPQEWLDAFARAWDDSAWTAQFGGFRDGYMRPLDDQGWKVRMRALHGLVSHGKQAIPVLLETLKRGDTPARILAAQTLGYLAPHVPHGPLLEAARNDDHPAVRLYAVDSLGMQGARDVPWDELLSAETNRDVRRHIGYAREREGEPLAPEVVEQLRTWNPDSIEGLRRLFRTERPAAVGQPAPDFQLRTATGETIRLSDFRGKKPVVLVFIYGDT